MTQTLETPFLGTNDTEAKLAAWLVDPGAPVSAGDEICMLETTKATIDITAEADGYLQIAVARDDIVRPGQILGFITDTPEADLDALLAAARPAAPDGAMGPTKKAELMMTRAGLDPAQVAAFAGPGRITAEVVERFVQNRAAPGPAPRQLGLETGTRLGIIGGVGGGGALLLADALARIPHQIATTIYDRDPAYHGRHVLGVQVSGTLEGRLDADLEAGRIDAVIIAFNRDLAERHTLFCDLRARGVPFANVIDPLAELRSGVELGTGNVILGRSWIGACAVLGDNNFLSANIGLEHGNVLGSSCAFGPGVFTSGNVTIGDRVRFGTGIFAEPGLTIGDDAVIGSGQTLVTDIRAGARLSTRSKS